VCECVNEASRGVCVYVRVIAGERVLLLEQQLARRTQDNVELSECLTESFQLAAQVCVGLYVDVYMGVFIH
jgi:hypothetical protein